MRAISTIKELRSIQLNILHCVHDFCTKNNITYMLAYGTLIGAIRHKGYIPWDDDIDIAMPRPDFEKFISTFNNSYPNIEVFTYNTNSSHLNPLPKIHDKSTILIEDIKSAGKMGIYIDLFPLDGLPEDETKCKRHINQLYWLGIVRSIKRQRLFRKRSILKNVVLAISQFLLFPFSYRFLLKVIDKKARKYAYEESSYVGSTVLFVRKNLRMKKEMLEKTIDVEFEGSLYKAPIGYDQWLKQLYGDYMIMPPKAEQIPHHEFEAYYK